MEEVGEFTIEEANKKAEDFKTDLSVKRKLDKDGNVIIDPYFLKHRYVLEPLEK